MKKRLLRDEPNMGDRGQYVYFDDSNTSYQNSNSTAINLFDKFDKRDLYTKVMEDDINDKIIKNALVPVGTSFFQINEIDIVNSGVKHWTKHNRATVAIFDRKRYEKNLASMDNFLQLAVEQVGLDNIDIPYLTSEQDDLFDNFEDAWSNIFDRRVDFSSNQLFDHNQTDPMRAGFATLVGTIFPQAYFNGDWYTNKLYEASGGDTININASGDTVTLPSDFDFRDPRIYRKSRSKVKTSKNYGKILRKQKIMEDLGLAIPKIPTYSGDREFDPHNSFFIDSSIPNMGGGWDTSVDPPEQILDGSPIMLDKDGFQDIYIAVYMRGNASRWWGHDRRKRRIQVFKFNSSQLFIGSGADAAGKTTELSFKYGDSNRRTGLGGKGGAEAAAWKVKSLKIKIDTTNSFKNVEGVEYDTAVTEMSSSVVPPKSLNFDKDTIAEDYLLQSNYQSIENLNHIINPSSMYSSDQLDAVTSNFEPITIINPLNFSYDLQAYQTASYDRQVCSAPGQIALDLKICDYPTSDTDLIPREYQPGTSEVTLGEPRLYDIPGKSGDDRFVTQKKHWLTGEVTTYGSTAARTETANQYCKQIGHDSVVSYTESDWVSGMGGFTMSPKDFCYWSSGDYWYQFNGGGSEYKFMNSITCNALPFSDILGYKFYVISWNDLDDKFKSIEDYFNDIPEDLGELILKNNQDLYQMTEIGIPLIHGYSTSGIKKIKGVLFSYTKTGLSQVVRWKFFESRFFLDLPLTKYPDFIELGGNDYTTIPWPYTSLVVGGLSEESNYKKSLQNTIAGGQISDAELLEERMLLESDDMDELGQSILNFDFEQIRYFNEPYSISDLLDIPVVNNTNFTPHNSAYWDCNDWNNERIYCFPDESSVGQIFIGDNMDLDVRTDCKVELNGGEIVDKSIYDSSGNSNKGLLFGDYKLKKREKDSPTFRDTTIKIPKKNNNEGGAL